MSVKQGLDNSLGSLWARTVVEELMMVTSASANFRGITDPKTRIDSLEPRLTETLLQSLTTTCLLVPSTILKLNRDSPASSKKS